MMLRTRRPAPLRTLLFVLALSSLSTVVLPLPTALAQGGEDPEPARAGRPWAPSDGIWFAEVVTDPQSDHDGSGSVTTSDESFVLFNAGTAPVTLDGWQVQMNDGTDSTEPLSGTLAPGARQVWLNPAGQMNNDVVLVLVDPQGATVDQVALGVDGVADGNADALLDEAVALVGPWAALRTPMVGTGTLGPVWVESVARTGANATAPFAAAWLGAGNASLDLRVHVAPDHAATPETLTVGSKVVSVNETDTTGLWRSDVFAAPSADSALRLETSVDNGTDTVDTHPDGTLLQVRIDASPPAWHAGAPVVNATGHVRWLPQLEDPESAIDTRAVHQQVNDTYVTITGCLPFEDPGDDCRLVDPSDPTRPANETSAAHATLRVTATNGAGATTQELRQVQVDVDAPVAPDTLEFAVGVPPSFSWSAANEPLKRIIVERAEDVTGVYTLDNETLAGNTTTFVDASYTPGDARAYRLHLVDRADLEAHTAWQALPPEAVPVAVAWPPVAEQTRTLVAEGQVDVVLGFDRKMAQPPALEFRGNDSSPFFLETDGVLAADGREAVYHVEVPGGFPWSGRGVWSVAGGAAEDDAVVAEETRDVSWDLEAPEVTIKDAPGHWVQSKRHVVTIEAWDAIDDDPRVVVTDKDEDDGVWGRRAARKVTLRGEGLHHVAGHAEDAEDNRRPFDLTIGLDPTPPVVRETERPGTWWNATSPIRIDIDDATSGVVRDAVRLWVRNATVTVQVAPAAWNGSVARFDAPQAIGAPFELHVAAADHAGNAAEGLLGAPLSGAVERTADQADEVTVTGPNGTTPASFTGPRWGTDVPLSDTDGNDASQGDPASGAFFDAESWRGAGSRETQKEQAEAQSGVWYVVGGLGSVGLATVGQRAWQRRKDVQEEGRRRARRD